MLTVNLFDLADFGGEDEVTFAQAIDAVRPNLDAGLAPGEIDVRVMICFFRDFTDAVDKFKRAAKVQELEFFFEALFVEDAPAAVELALHFFQGVAFERGRSAAAWFAFFLG